MHSAQACGVEGCQHCCARTKQNQKGHLNAPPTRSRRCWGILCTPSCSHFTLSPNILIVTSSRAPCPNSAEPAMAASEAIRWAPIVTGRSACANLQSVCTGVSAKRGAILYDSPAPMRALTVTRTALLSGSLGCTLVGVNVSCLGSTTTSFVGLSAPSLDTCITSKVMQHWTSSATCLVHFPIRENASGVLSEMACPPGACGVPSDEFAHLAMK